MSALSRFRLTQVNLEAILFRQAVAFNVTNLSARHYSQIIETDARLPTKPVERSKSHRIRGFHHEPRFNVSASSSGVGLRRSEVTVASRRTIPRVMTMLLQQFNNENKYLHDKLHSRLRVLPNSWKNLDLTGAKDLINSVAMLSKQGNSNEQQYKDNRSELFKEFKSLIRGMNLESLAALLAEIKHIEMLEFRALRKILDVELSYRLETGGKIHGPEVDIWFYLAGLFFECAMISRLTPQIIKCMANGGDIVLNDQQFVHLLFLVNLQRTHMGLLAPKNESRILKILKDPSIEDIAAICLAYFKTQTQIRNPEIANTIIKHATNLLPSIDPTQPGYCAIVKCIRSSRESCRREEVTGLIDKLTKDPDCAKVLGTSFNLMQTVKLIETYRIFDSKMLDILGQSIINRPEEFRIKDIQYALSSLSNFKWKNLVLDDPLRAGFDRLCGPIIARSRADASYQHNHLIPLLRAFIYYGYYNDEFIAHVNEFFGNHEEVERLRARVLDFDKSTLLAHTAISLEGGGTKLQNSHGLFERMSASINRHGSSGSVRQDSSIQHLSFILHPVEGDKYFALTGKMRSLAKSLSSMDGLSSPDYHYNFQFTMAHQNYADLVITKNMPAPGQFDPTSLLPKQVAPTEANQKRPCLVYAIQNSDFMDGRDRLSGYKELIIRLLTKLGYNVLVFNLDSFDIDHLASRIRSALD